MINSKELPIEPKLSILRVSTKGFRIINNQNIKEKGKYLWRYLDIHKFLDFNLSNEIVFNRMDQFSDPLEGVPLASLIMFAEEADQKFIKDLTLSEIILNKNFADDLSEKMRKQIIRTREFQLKTYASCWFLSDAESMAMWGLYSNPDGLVIRFNLKFILNQIQEAYNKVIYENKNIKTGYCGMVKYLSFKTIKPYEGNKDFGAKLGLRKEKSYEHEKEFRFIINTNHTDLKIKNIRLKLSNISPKSFSIFTHPKMKEWKRNNLKKMLQGSKIEGRIFNSEITLRD